jgi:Transposase DDE domain
MSQRQLKITSPAFGQQVRSLLLELVLAHLPLGIAGDKINDEVAWEILCYAATRRTSLEQAALALVSAPSANTVREHLNAVLDPTPTGLAELEALINQTLAAQLPPFARRLVRRRRVEVAGDLTDLPYHGQPLVSEEEIRRSQAKSGTTHFHSYATLQIVHHRQRLTLALTFVRKGEKMDTVVARLLRLARARGVRIKRAYFDKGFASVAVFRLLRQRRIPYLIAVPARGSEQGLKQFFRGRQSQRVRYTFNRRTKQPYTTELVIVRKEFKERQVRYFAYAVYRLGRTELSQVYEQYRRRFCIETGYRQLHQVRARTASQHPGLRLLLVGLAVLLVNYWVLLSASCGSVTSYGGRMRIHELTLEQLASALLDEIKRRYGSLEIIQAYSPWDKR